MPWEPIAKLLGSPKHVRVWRDYGGDYRVPLRAQVDRIEKDDRSRDELVFTLDAPLRPGDEDYGSVSGYALIEPEDNPPLDGGPRVDALPTGVSFSDGDDFYAWLNTSSNHDDPKNHWFGGAVTSVRRYGRELLDPIADETGLPFDPDKRGAQIDRIHFVRPPWDEDGSFDEFVFNKYWECKVTSSGPVRATATIVSQPFPFTCRDADQRPRRFACSVHRSVSIYAGGDVIVEKIRVSADVEGPTPVVDMWFSARYFMLVNLSFGPITFRYPDHPGWFAVLAEDSRAKHGYAFATDAYAGPIWHPPLEHKDPSTGHRAYSWELGATRLASVVHLFRRDTTTKALTDAIGWHWYDHLYKPLRAGL